MRIMIKKAKLQSGPNAGKHVVWLYAPIVGKRLRVGVAEAVGGGIWIGEFPLKHGGLHRIAAATREEFEFEVFAFLQD